MGAPVIFKGNNAKFLKENLEFTNAQYKHNTFAAANNVASAADVTGLDLSGFRGGDLTISVAIDATADLYATFTLKAIEKGGSWEMTQKYAGDETNINFTITAGGQVQYTSGNEAGFVSSTFTFSASLTKE
jgi:hypothetical protein